MSNIDRIEIGSDVDTLVNHGIRLPKRQINNNVMNPYVSTRSFYNESVTRYHRTADAFIAINTLLNAYGNDDDVWCNIIDNYPELNKIKSEVRRLAYVYKTYGDAKGYSKPLNRLMAKFYRIYDDILMAYEVALFIKAAWTAKDKKAIFKGLNYHIATIAWGNNDTQMFAGFHLNCEWQNCRYGVVTDNGELTQSEYRTLGRLCNRLGGTSK